MERETESTWRWSISLEVGSLRGSDTPVLDPPPPPEGGRTSVSQEGTGRSGATANDENRWGGRVRPGVPGSFPWFKGTRRLSASRPSSATEDAGDPRSLRAQSRRGSAGLVSPSAPAPVRPCFTFSVLTDFSSSHPRRFPALLVQAPGPPRFPPPAPGRSTVSAAIRGRRREGGRD